MQTTLSELIARIITHNKGRKLIFVVVDDEADLVDLISDSLEDLPIDVIAASSAEEAVRVAGSYILDVVLFDIFMPGKGGIWLAESMRKAHPEAEFIAMSGGWSAMSGAKTLAAAEKVGVQWRLEKPFTIDHLHEVLINALTSRYPALNKAPDGNATPSRAASPPDRKSTETKTGKSGEQPGARLLRSIELKTPVIVKPTATMFEVVHEMRLGGSDFVIVSTDGETVEAVLTERDIVMGIDRVGLNYMVKKVGEYILHKPIACDADETLNHAVSMMRNHKIRHLPVTQDDTLIGVLGVLEAIDQLNVIDPLNID